MMNGQTDRQADRQTARQADRQTGRQTYKAEICQSTEAYRHRER